MSDLIDLISRTASREELVDLLRGTEKKRQEETDLLRREVERFRGDADRVNRLEKQVDVLAKAVRQAAWQCSHCPCYPSCGRDGECTVTIKAWSVEQAEGKAEGKEEVKRE